MAPGAVAKKVQESKVATYGDVRPHHFIPFGVEVYGGLGPAAYGFLRKTQRRFRERRYMEANAEGGEQVDGNGDEDEDEDEGEGEEAARGGAVGWKEKWVRLLSFALARGVAGLIIRRAVGRCPDGSGWRWVGGGRVGGGMGPDLDRGEADRRKGAERLALMDRAWEDAFEEIDYAMQDGSGGGMQESEGTQREQSGQAPGEAGEAGAMASRLLESMEDVRREAEHPGTVGGQGGGTAEARSGGARAGIGRLSQAASSVEDILNEWDDLLSPGPGSGVWTQEQSGASLEQAMALAEGGVATLMGRAGGWPAFLEGLMAWGKLMRMTGEMWGGPRVEMTHVGPLRARGPILAAMTTYNTLHGSIRHLISFRAHWALPCPSGEVAGRAGTHITAQVWSAFLKFAATSQGNQRKGSSHGELVQGVEGYRRKPVADAQVWMRATQFIILSPLGQRLGILAVAWRHSGSAPAGQPQRGSGGPVRLREQRGGLARGLGGGDMARAARGAGMNRPQAQGGSALVVQMQRGSVLDAEGPGQHVLFDVATARPMSDAHLGAAMMAPGAVAKKRRFRERRYMEANAEGGEQVDGNGDEDEDEDEEAARGGAVGWKEKWVRLLSFALARGVAGLIIRRAVGRCPAGSGWRWAGGGRVGGGMGPDLDRGEADRREGAERLALMDRAWEDAFEETDYATQDGSGGGMQESEGTQRERSGQASGEAGEAGAMASRLLESMEDVRREVEHLGTVGGQGGGTAEARSGGARAGIGGLSQAASSVEDILNEWDDLLSPGPESGVWTQEQSGASPEQAMALAEGGVATLMGASRRVAGLLGGVDGMGGTDEDDGGDVGRRKSVVDAQVWMRATQFIILSPLGQRLGILAVAWVGKLS
ncbi:hypothetical protein CYMTET_4449 [Cymbomonas tetramitiformis]|uniref:Uncharacterized protein n=1 Tax=Cymbomonas tetramitiformis TaxID=36881 RepID=A0AAE0H152_9CHLO|nr:hypothetical protein CYMTET_4449 [Cymbomonas tetramitiformis]